jgi:hypothetical protein
MLMVVLFGSLLELLLVVMLLVVMLLVLMLSWSMSGVAVSLLSVSGVKPRELSQDVSHRSSSSLISTWPLSSCPWQS